MFRYLRQRYSSQPSETPFAAQKRDKLRRIKPLLKRGLPCTKTDLHYNFLTDDLKAKYHIIDTDNVSAHDYDPIACNLIEQHRNGMLLDCGAGKRSTYYPNVVNFEIVPYDTTDVLGVGEELPFADQTFDAVFSLNVLEHVTNPFQCAAEIVRVMKPNATLYCVVPFLQALHGYPNHYYNMTHAGLRNLFDQKLTIHNQDVFPSGLPIWTLNHVLRRWLSDLDEATREQFASMQIKDLLNDPITYLEQPFVTQMSKEVQFELASTTALIATKPAR